MNGEQFYEAFKQALKILGLRWDEKALVTVELRDNRLYFINGDRGFFIALEGKENGSSSQN